MSLILPLAAAGGVHPLVGGKAANLGALRGAGVVVPDGFCVTTEAYQDFVAAHDLAATISTTLGSIDVGDVAALTQASEVIRDAFESAPLPTAIAEALPQAYAELGGGRVAVRSSATLEDLEGATFAGQHETFLGVSGAAELVERVRACWASLYTPQAIRYRAERGFDQLDVALAVLVQRMLDPEAAGVAFTANPLTGDASEVHVSATFGLGETLVAGLATPDTFVLRLPALDLAYVEVGEKTVALRLDGTDGVREVSVPEAQRTELSITPAQAEQVAGVAGRLAAHFGAPQDVEWAFQGGELFVLQSRPMVIRRDEMRWESPVPGARWHRNWRLGEWLSAPVTPLFATALLPRLVAGREEQGVGHLGWNQPPNFAMVQPWYCIMNGYFYTRDDRDTTTAVTAPDATPEERLQRAANNITSLHEWRRRHRPAYRRERLPALARFDVRRATAGEILVHLDALYRDAAEWWYLISRIGFGGEEGSFRQSYEALVPEPRVPTAAIFSGYDNQTLASQRALYALLGMIETEPALRTLFLEHDPAEILAALRPGRAEQPHGAASAHAQAVWQGLRTYLSRHGHQVFTLDFATPTLGEQPALSVAVLQSYLRYRPEPPTRELARRRSERRAALRHIARTRKETSAWQSFRSQLDWRLECAATRENAIYDFQRLWPLMRRALRELGARLVATDVLDDPDDLFFLEQDELEAAALVLDADGPHPLTPSPNSGRGGDLAEVGLSNGPLRGGTRVDRDDARSGALPPRPDLGEEGRGGEGLRARVAARRAERERLARLSPPGQIPTSAPPVTRAQSSGPTGHLEEDVHGRRLMGHAASPGRAQGPARVLRTPEDFGRFRPGDVLVAVTTSPAWTVLFPMAAAVVTEVGGGATHSSLVAREYGIPAVVATGIATQVIRDGQVVTVDGSRGIVFLTSSDSVSS